MSGVVKVAKKIENKVSRAILPGPLGALDRKVRGKVQDYVLNGKKKDPMRIDQGQLSDLSVQGSAYGASVPQVLGPWRESGEIIWATPKKPTPHTETQTVGGKGGLFGGGSQDIQTTTYTYSVSLAIHLADCRDGNQIAGIAKIWANGKLIYNIAAASNFQSYIASLGWASALRFYPGSATQLPDPLIVATEGGAPAWRGSAYLVIENLQLAEWDNAVPNIEVELVPVGTFSSQMFFLDTPGQLYWGPVDYFCVCELSIMNDGNLAVSMQKTFGSTTQITVRNPFDLSVVRTIGQMQALVRSVHVNQYGATFTGSHYIPQGGVPQLIGLDLHTPGAMDLDGNFYGSGRWIYDTPDTKFVFQIKADGTLRVIRSWVLINGENHYPYSLFYGHSGYLYLNCTQGSSFAGWLWKIDIATGQIVKQGTIYFYLKDMVVLNDDTIYAFDSLGSNLYRVPPTWDSATLVHAGSSAAYSHREMVWRDWQNNRVLASFRSELRSWAADGSYELINPASGPDFYGKASHPSYPGRFYSYRREPFAFNNNNSVAAYRQSLSGGTVNVSGAISRLCSAAGLTAGEIDVTGVTATFGGGARSEQMTARAALEPLISAFMLQVVDTGTKLKFVPYGAASVATIAPDDLMMIGSGEDYTAVDTDDQEESELPSELHVQFRDSARNYLSDAQYARRLVTTSRNIETLQYQLVMTATQARQLAHAKLFSQWVARKGRRFALSRKWAKLEAGDVITVPINGANVNVLLRTVKDEGIRRVCEAEDNEAAVYTQTVAGNAGSAQSGTVTAVSPMLTHILDVALVRDAEDDHGMYVAAGGVLAGWTGGRLYKSTDGGVTFADTALTFTSTSIIGTAVGVLGNFSSGNIFDELNAVDVLVSGGALASITEAQARADTDMLLIGDELVTPKNRVLIAANTYRLSGFLRGRRGTEWAMGRHTAGERVVVLSATAARNLPMASSEFGQERAFKGVSFGGLLATATQQSATYRAERLRPRAPAALWGGRDASGNISGSLIRSARRGTAWLNLVGVPLDEDAEAYEIDIYAGTALGITAITAAAKAEITFTGTAPAVGESVYLHSIGGMVQLNERVVTVLAIVSGNRLQIDVDTTGYAPYTSGGSVLKRKPSGTIAIAGTTVWSYSSAQQVTDYGANQTSVRAAGQQISSRVGRGIAKTAII